MLSPRISTSLVAVTVALALGLTAGCGGSDEPKKATSSPTSKVTGPGSQPSENFDVGHRYFAAVASNDASQLRAAADLAAPKSVAAAYLERLAARATGTSARLTDLGEGRYWVCPADGGKCTSYSGVGLVSAKVVFFKVNGKQLSKKNVATIG